MLPRLAALKPENHWAFVPFMFFVLAFEPRDYVINICCLKHLDVCKLKLCCSVSPIFLGEFWLERFCSHE
jgi:hypothetical protein